MELAKTYSPVEIESKWYKIWEESGYFKPTFKDGAPNYCINLPPPNVTGTLHMGHGFQHTLMDTLIRYHRMRGFNTLWQPGTDHAGIATQMVVERNLELEGITRKDLGREAFINKIWEWKEYSGNTIAKQMRRLGSSCDWSRERFTMDEGLSQAVIEVFTRLYEEGYIYRGFRLVNWDVRRQTAVSDLEVKSVEENGSIWHIRYPVLDESEFIVIATTRPETMLGDVAVAINPSDERYKHLIGKKLILPLVGREIPIIADDYVDIEFGTGCVKITPAHDFNDYEIGKRHNLEAINILTLDGHINDNAPLKYRSLERFEARKAIIADLESLGLLVETKPHKLMVPRGERDDVILEPMLTHQWFCRMDKFAKEALRLVHDGEIRFVPNNWCVIYDQWLENIQDWCISRQLWWGHRIPAYYDENGNIFVAKNLEDAVIKAGTDKLTQEPDVLDTWFSAALWSFSPLGWPKNTQELDAFLPSSVLVTGFDIIFFWVARMVMFTKQFTGKVPFKDVFVTGLILDTHGQKMSKSKGNVIDPLDLVDGISKDDLIAKRTKNLMNPKQAEKIAKQTSKDYPDGFKPFGADAVRFNFAALSTHGREVRFDVGRIEGSRNFCNKLWNATRFVLMNVNHSDFIGRDAKLGVIDNWILASLQKLIIDVDFAYETYRFDILTQRIYEFVWNDYCDWYLELAKVNLASEDIEVKTATVNTLLRVLDATLRIIHPLMPFITEELWQEVALVYGKKDTASIMIAEYPKQDEFDLLDSPSANKDIDLLKDLCLLIRNLRAEMNLSPAIKVPLEIEVSDEYYYIIRSFAIYLQSLTKLSEVKIVDNLSNNNAPIAICRNMRLTLDVKIDKDVEKKRIEKELEKLSKELEKIKFKLDNPSYIEKAPKDLVERDTLRVNELSGKIDHFTSQLNQLN
ncbi:MAG: valine--tRNA ligase [Neisseriaceae bacterium]